MAIPKAADAAKQAAEVRRQQEQVMEDRLGKAITNATSQGLWEFKLTMTPSEVEMAKRLLRAAGSPGMQYRVSHGPLAPPKADRRFMAEYDDDNPHAMFEVTIGIPDPDKSRPPGRHQFPDNK